MVGSALHALGLPVLKAPGWVPCTSAQPIITRIVPHLKLTRMLLANTQ
jgi:hypothetical protein